MKQPQIICFGEVLWDVLSSGPVPGGAPMNVAIHLMYQGLTPKLISRVGDDKLGRDLLKFISEKGLETDLIQVDKQRNTSTVVANVSNRTDVKYKIVEDVAWDHISYDEATAKAVEESEVFVYGSLATRNDTTYNTLIRYLKLAKRKVIDVNFRPPHYNTERIQELLQYADIAKMNHHELEEVMSWYEPHSDLETSMAFLKKHFSLDLLVVTCGENGAAALNQHGFVQQAGIKVEVEDTIGSGDAFLATFLRFYLQQKNIEDALENASIAGALVATHKGATPQIDLSQLASNSKTP